MSGLCFKRRVQIRQNMDRKTTFSLLGLQEAVYPHSR
jgi:hypothetical protein